MLTDEESKRLVLESKTNFTIWLAIVGSLFMYLAVGYLALDQVGEPEEGGPGLLGIVLSVLSVATIGTAFLFRYVALPLTADRPLTEDPAEIVAKAFARYRQRMIVSLALGEAVGIYGLILTILSHDIFWGGSLIGMGIVFQILFRPGTNELEEYALAQKRLTGRPSRKET